MDTSLEEQSEHVSMSDNTNSFEECCSKPTEVYADNSNLNSIVRSAEECCSKPTEVYADDSNLNSTVRRAEECCSKPTEVYADDSNLNSTVRSAEECYSKPTEVYADDSNPNSTVRRAEECCSKPTEVYADDSNPNSTVRRAEECCSKPTEVHTDNSNLNSTVRSAEEFVQINDRNENLCNDAGTVVPDKNDTETQVVMDLLVKLGNDTAVFNINKSLERVRYMINSISVEDILSSPILPHQRCVTYISEAQKTIKGNQKENVFKFVCSYPSCYNRLRKYRTKTEVPVIIIGDVTKIHEDHCSYVFICAYLNEVTVVSGKRVKARGLLGTHSSITNESSDSSDDGSSSVDSSEDSSRSDFSSSDENEEENKNSNKVAEKHESVKPIAVDVRNPLVFLEDGAADKLPPVRECDMKVPKENCIKIGYVMHIHKLLISVQGLKDSPALNADTLLFLEDDEDDKSLRSLGFIYEVIGPVGEPVYCITFKEEQNIEKKQVRQGALVYIYPSSEHTHFVFVQDLLKQKGSDASWKNDVEPPEQYLEYSDDEEERLAKQKLKQASSKESSSNAAVKRKSTDEKNPEKSQVFKRRKGKVIKQDVEASEVDTGCVESVGPQVHPGTIDSQHNRIGARLAIGRSKRVPPGPSGNQHNGIGSSCAPGRGQRILHAVQANSNRSMQFIVPPGPSDNQHNIGSYCAPGRGQRIFHAVQGNGEVGNRSMSPIVRPGPSDNQHNFGSYCAPGRGQRIFHAVQENGEVGNRSMRPGPSDSQHNGVGSYCAPGRGQRILHAMQANSMQPPRMQHYRFAMQQPPRMQQFTPAPAVNRPFMSVPPPPLPANQHLLQQQRAYFNPRVTSPFAPPQQQFHNPPQ